MIKTVRTDSKIVYLLVKTALWWKESPLGHPSPQPPNTLPSMTQHCIARLFPRTGGKGTDCIHGIAEYPELERTPQGSSPTLKWAACTRVEHRTLLALCSNQLLNGFLLKLFSLKEQASYGYLACCFKTWSNYSHILHCQNHCRWLPNSQSCELVMLAFVGTVENKSSKWML